jgi:hypothetical protein
MCSASHTEDVETIIQLVPNCAVSLVMKAMTVMIRCLNSGKDRGRGGTNALSFMYPHKKKSHGVKSGDLGGHLHHTTSLAPARPIHLRGRCAFR